MSHGVSDVLDYSDPTRNGFKHLIRIESGQIWVLKTPTPLDYGDQIQFEGRCWVPEGSRNPGGFDYRAYLTVRGIEGVCKASRIKVVGHRLGNPIKRLAHSMRGWIWGKLSSVLRVPYDSLLMALIFGDEGIRLGDDLVDSFQRLGLTHLIVVSGAQVALLTQGVMGIFKVIGVPSRYVMPILIPIQCVFYLLCGGGVSILRSMVMTDLLLVGRRLQRRVTDVHILCLTALVLVLWNPMVIWQAGAILSFMVTAGLLFGVPAVKESLPDSWSEPVRTFVSLIAVPFLITAPFLWGMFHTLSLGALVGNAALMAVIEWVVPLGVLACIGFLFIPWMSTFLLVGLEQSLRGVVWLTHYLGQISWLQWGVGNPPVWVIGLVYGWMGIVFWWCLTPPSKDVQNRFLKIVTWFGLGLGLAGFLIWFWMPGSLKITFLDVGQGDATLIQFPNKRTLLIDAGNAMTAVDNGRKVVVPALRYFGINRLDGVMISHFDLDHYGGVGYLLDNVSVGRLMVTNSEKGKAVLLTYPQGVKYHEISRGKSISIDDLVDVKILFPISGKQVLSENNHSIIVRLDYGKCSVLLTGDLEEEGELELLRYWPDYLDVEVLKVGHHGSKSSTTEPFLDRVSPKIGIVSAGRRNRYNHPHPSVIDRLKDRGIQILRTDQLGAIQIESDSGECRVVSWD
ncbi:DNA internalization-related competence protein ComEC/Rec2 [bacterium]|nr:DNA internalization-related competence protein ComEC/Rec2 [bacterium]